MRRIKPDHDKSIFSHDQRLCGELSEIFAIGEPENLRKPRKSSSNTKEENIFSDSMPSPLSGLRVHRNLVVRKSFVEYP
jgi:hypothetical protein